MGSVRGTSVAWAGSSVGAAVVFFVAFVRPEEDFWYVLVPNPDGGVERGVPLVVALAEVRGQGHQSSS